MQYCFEAGFDLLKDFLLNYDRQIDWIAIETTTGTAPAPALVPDHAGDTERYFTKNANMKICQPTWVGTPAITAWAKPQTTCGAYLFNYNSLLFSDAF